RIIPPNGSIHPNPMSSMTMYITFGEPSGATGGMGKAASESSYVRPIRPGNRSPSRYVFITRQTLRLSSSVTPEHRADHCEARGARRPRLVGEGGFEPPTSCTQSRCATAAPLPVAVAEPTGG